jgi:hypothetical protein
LYWNSIGLEKTISDCLAIVMQQHKQLEIRQHGSHEWLHGSCHAQSVDPMVTPHLMLSKDYTSWAGLVFLSDLMFIATAIPLSIHQI